MKDTLTYFDLDGIVVDFTRDIFIPAGEQVLCWKLPQLSEDTYDLADQLGLTTREHDRIWASPELKFRMLTAPVINRECHQLVAGSGRHIFITSRGCDPRIPDWQGFRELTEHWVRHALKDDSPVFFAGPHEKALVARTLGVNTAWEDHPTIVADLVAAGIRVSMPVYDYNRKLAHPLIHRVENWRRPIREVA